MSRRRRGALGIVRLEGSLTQAVRRQAGGRLAGPVICAGWQRAGWAGWAGLLRIVVASAKRFQKAAAAPRRPRPRRAAATMAGRWFTMRGRRFEGRARDVLSQRARRARLWGHKAEADLRLSAPGRAAGGGGLGCNLACRTSHRKPTWLHLVRLRATSSPMLAGVGQPAALHPARSAAACANFPGCGLRAAGCVLLACGTSAAALTRARKQSGRLQTRRRRANRSRARRPGGDAPAGSESADESMSMPQIALLNRV